MIYLKVSQKLLSGARLCTLKLDSASADEDVYQHMKMFISINQFSNDYVLELNFSHFMGKQIVIHKVLLMCT